MLVVRGPVSADGYEWYEVQPDDGPFGWVAAGKGGEDWIEPASAAMHRRPRRGGGLDGRSDRLPRLLWRHAGERPGGVRACGDTATPGTRSRRARTPASDVPCTARPRWLFEARELRVRVLRAPPERRDSAPPAHGSVADRLDQVPPVAAMTLTLSMDAPQARDCRIVDRRGRDLISRDEAITRCRLTFVVRDVDVGRGRPPPGTRDPGAGRRDGPARAREPGTGSTSARSRPATRSSSPTSPCDVDGVRWYPVLPSDRAGRAFGWVPFIGPSGEPTLEVSSPRCPSLRNWRAVVALSPAGRLTCFDSPGGRAEPARRANRSPARRRRGVRHLSVERAAAPPVHAEAGVAGDGLGRHRGGSA